MLKRLARWLGFFKGDVPTPKDKVLGQLQAACSREVVAAERRASNR